MLFASVSAFGQSDSPSCGSDLIHERELEENEFYQRSWFNFEQSLQRMHDERGHDRSDDIYVIPVVIHVIHEGEAVGVGSNISDEQVFSAIEALNEDFRKLPGTNGDGDGVDVGIEFCLASRDPDGNSTTGIQRVDGSVIPPYAEEGINVNGDFGADEEAIKSLSVWPREDYMNVWIVNEIENNNAGGGIQGFAYFPFDNIRDGIVLLHNAFGTVGNLKSNTDMNRTFSHEVGHYFGLYHTFHGTNDCDDESNCSSQGDRVCDTPPTTLGGNCNNPACGGTQQVENYMDYTAETCRDMFTEGQRERMRNTLVSQRATLLQSFGCEPVVADDVGITSVSHPSGILCNNSFEPEVFLTNFGSSSLSSCTIQYNVTGGATQTFTWNGNLSPGTSEWVTLPAMFAATGSHTFFAWASEPNGVADANASNNEAETEFIVSTGDGVTLNITVDFFGTETTWSVFENDVEIVNGGPYINNSQGTTFEETLCLPAGCYTLVMYDAYGDGQSFTNGSYELLGADGTAIAEGGGDWGLEASHEFCVEANNDPVPPVANFSFSASGGCEEASVDFSDMSLGNPTSWSWSFPGGSPGSSSSQNPQNIFYETPGTYNASLLVSNADGSDSHTIEAIITVNEAPDYTMIPSAPSCHDGNNGAIDLSIANPASFSFQWSNGATTQNLSGVSPGSYSVAVTNASGCITEQTATVPNPSAISLTMNSVNISCNGASDGLASVSTGGGNGPFGLSWNTGQSGSTISGLPAGSYTVTAIDVNGCSANASVSVTEPQELTINLFDEDIGCNGNPGAATASVQGGTPPYAYNWSTGETGEAITGLAPGSYSVSVTDANGCSINEDFDITEADGLNVNATATPVLCSGETNGSVSALATGGNGSYFYLWSNGAQGASIGNMAPGEYTVNVSDSDGCEGSASVTIEEPAALNLTVFKSDISCAGMNDGTANATITGGTPPYVFNWNSGDDAQVLSSLSAGTYMLEVTDGNGCQAVESVQIIEPSALSGEALLLNPETCAGQDGQAIINAMGGTGNLSFNWSNGSTGNLLENVSSGIYSVTISDDNGCSVINNVEVPYECDVAPEFTQLDENSCGSINLLLDDEVYCIPVAGAEMYHWRFTNSANGFYNEAYSIGNNPGFVLSSVSGLGYAETLEVSIRVMNSDEIWSDWGPVCTISTSETVPETSISTTDCSLGVFDTANLLTCNAVTGTSVYEWSFAHAAHDTVITSFLPQLMVPQAEWIEGGQYEVRVRAGVNELFSNWSSSCVLQFGTPSGVNDSDDQLFVTSIFPNPGNGEKISIAFGNLHQDGDVLEISVYDNNGRRVENTQLSIVSEQEHLTLFFTNRLAPGMYILQVRSFGQVFEEKLMIR